LISSGIITDKKIGKGSPNCSDGSESGEVEVGTCSESKPDVKLPNLNFVCSYSGTRRCSGMITCSTSCKLDCESLSDKPFTTDALAFSVMLAEGETASATLVSASVVGDFFVDFGFHSLIG
jgi:hypothetical protein